MYQRIWKMVVVFCHFVMIVPNVFANSNATFAQGYQPSKDGMCGRDCAYYIAKNLGIETSLKEIEDKLGNRPEATMLQLNNLFVDMELHCKAYKITKRHYALLGTLAEKNRVYVLCAFPTNDPTMNHFVVVSGRTSKGIEIYDPSTNRLHFFDIQKAQEKLRDLTILVVSKDTSGFFWTKATIRYLLESYFILTVFFSICTLSFFAVYYGKNKSSLWSMLWQFFQTHRMRISLKSILVLCLLIVVVFFVYVGTTATRGREAPFRIDTPHLDFGEMLVGTVRNFTLTLTNTSDNQIQINDVKTSCGCLVPLSKPSEISKQKSVSVEFLVNALREGSNAYQIIIESERKKQITHAVARVEFRGVRKARILPIKCTLANFANGETTSQILSCRLADSPNTPFILESVSVGHPESHLQVTCPTPAEINDGDTFEVNIVYDGLATCGRWCDILLLIGKDKNTGERLVFSSELTGHIVCNQCQKMIGFTPDSY